MPPTPLELAIAEAVAWADGFDLGLTPFELWQQCPHPATLAEVLRTIQSSAWLAERTETIDGLVVLRGRSSLAGERRCRLSANWQKFRRLRRLTWLLARLPFIRLVAACNTLGLAHAKPESDIDLLIVTAAGRIWSARLWAVLAATLVGGRPRPEAATDRLCLSFYVSEANLDVSDVAEPNIEADRYLRAWVSWVLPLYDAGGYAASFAQANVWVRGYLPHSPWPALPPRWQVHHRHRWLVRIVERLWPSWLERTAERFERRYLPAATRAAAAASTTTVVLNDTRLKFHVTDRRSTINTCFLQRLNDVCR